MRFLYFIFVFFISCSVLKKSPEVSISAPPDNVMIVIEEGQSVYVPVGDVLDSNDVTRFSDTLTTLATKSEIGTGGLDGFQNSNDSTVLSTPSMDYTIRRDIVTFDIPDSIQGTFPVGTLIRTRGFYSPGDGAGALYQVQADSVAGYVNDTAAVVPLTSGYAILQPVDNSYNLKHFGAVGDGVTNNGDIPYRASRFVNGKHRIFIPHGVFVYDSTIYFGKRGINMFGVGSNYATNENASILKYIGTDAAIKNDPSLNVIGISEPNRITLRDFAVMGTDTATYGLEFDVITYPGSSGNISGAIVNNVSIAGFTDTLAFAVKLSRVYGSSFENIYIESCGNGYFLSTESVQNRIKDNWISVPGHGIYQTYGLNIVDGGIFGGGSSPDDSQRGIYVVAGPIVINSVHFESNYRPIEAIGGDLMISNCRFNSSTASALFNDIANVSMVGNYLPSNQNITAGLRTTWIGDIEGQHTIPTISADNPNGFATITRLSGNFTLTTFNNTGVPDGPFTLIFTNDSVTVASRETSIPFIHLKDGIDFKGYTGDMLVLQKRENIGGTITLHEIARFRHNDNYMQNRSSDYTVLRGDHGLTFTNKGATDTVTFTIPSPGQLNDNMQYTFIKLDSDPMRIKTTGSPRRIRGGASDSYLYLSNVGSTVTLRLDSLFYEIVSSGGMYTFSNPDPGNEGGNFAGIGLGELQDSLALVSYTAGRFLIGSGGTTHTTYPGLTTNAVTNQLRINVDNQGTSSAELYMGIGYEPNGSTGIISSLPNINGHNVETSNTSYGALFLSGMRYAGTYATKTNLTNDTIPLVSIAGYGWRSSSPRTAAQIMIHGDDLFGSSTGFSGAIGFSTSEQTTFSRKMTLHRNGDLYLGVGLKSFGLETISSKLLIRGDGTTTGNLFLAEDSNGDDKFILQDNGTITLPVSPTLNNTADSVVVRNNVTGSLEVRSATSISGGYSAYTAQNSTYNVTASDNIIECTANSFTLNFPSAVGLTGKEWTVKNTGVGTITIEPDGAETIDGQSNTTLTTQYESITIFSNGTNLLIK